MKSWWCETFPDSQFYHFGVEKLSNADRNYATRFRRTRKSLSSLDLDILRSVRQERHRHHQFLLPVDVTEATGMCPDVLVEITKSLSLNDAMNAFSIRIVP
jgi:hypothetical protein